MKSNAMMAFLINTIILIICANGLLLLKAALGCIPFQFYPFWGLIAPILFGAASVLTLVRKANLK